MKKKKRLNRYLNSLIASKEVSVSCYGVEENSINLVFWQASAQFPQALWRILLHFGLTENPVPVTWRGLKRFKKKIRRGNKQEKSEN